MFLFSKDVLIKEKIREAVFYLGNDCAPGPDGFPIGFFQHFWNLFIDDLLGFIFSMNFMKMVC